jgi:Transposase
MVAQGLLVNLDGGLLLGLYERTNLAKDISLPPGPPSSTEFRLGIPAESQAVTPILSVIGGLPAGTPAAFEAAYGWGWLVELLEDYGFEPHLVHPLQCKAIASARLKNDKVDAAILAQLLRADLLPEAWIAPPAVRQLRALLRHRAQLVRLRTLLQNRIHAVLADHGHDRPAGCWSGPGRQWLASLELPAVSAEVISDALALIDALDSVIDRLDTEVRQHARSDPAGQGPDPAARRRPVHRAGPAGQAYHIAPFGHRLTAAQIIQWRPLIITVVIIGGLVVPALWLWMARANGQGRNWARTLSTVLFGLATLRLAGWIKDGVALVLIAALTWLAGLAVVWLLWRPASSAFFKPQDFTPAGSGAQLSSRISIIQARLPRPW